MKGITRCISSFFLFFFSFPVFSTTPHAYVSETDGGAISIIDVNRNTVQKIFGFDRPHVVKVNFEGTSAYVGDINNSIYEITCIEHTVNKIGTLSSHPIAFCILPDASYLYAATHAGTVAIVNLQTKIVEKEIPGLNGPQDIRATPDGRYVYVTNKGNGTVSIIRTSDQTYFKTIQGFKSPVGITFDIDGKNAYVTDNSNDCLYVVDLASDTIKSTILGLSNPRYIAMAPKKTVAYISNGGNDTISILRLSDNFIIGSIPVPNPNALTVTADGLYLYVTGGSNEVFKIQTLDNQIELALPGFKSPTNLSFTDNNAPPDTVNGWQVVLDKLLPFNQISWKKPSGYPYQYRIYRDVHFKKLMATIPATSEDNYLYNDIDRNPGQTYYYYVIADYPNGFSSTIGEIVITSKRVGLQRTSS